MREDLLFKNLVYNSDGIYSYNFSNTEQKKELEFRESVAEHDYSDYLLEISRHHSIPVMDREVRIFLKRIPQNGLIIDVGGCWGWHWRNLRASRPDVKVVIVDFVKKNLENAKKILGNQVNKNIFLVHGDATSLAFSDEVFDGWWSVQVLQHIPNFEVAITEAWRVLKKGGVFCNYSLNNQFLVRVIYRLLGKYYHISGVIPGSIYFDRANDKFTDTIRRVFFCRIRKRYSEVLFSPELKIVFPGRLNSWFGKLDSFLSSNFSVFSWIARQVSFHTRKRIEIS